MSEPRHLRALVELVHLLIEGANLRHLAIHVKVCSSSIRGSITPVVIASLPSEVPI